MADSWTVKAAMPEARVEHTSAWCNGKLYVFGGRTNAASETDHVREWDPATDTWSSKTAMPQTRNQAAAVGVGTKVYVIAGWRFGENTAQSTVYEYDTVADSWSTKTAMSAARAEMGWFEDSGIIYIVGGRTDASATALDTLFAYDVAGDSWSTKTAMGTGYKRTAAAAVNGVGYKVAGITGTTSNTGDVRSYDISADTWSTTPADLSPTTLERHRACAIAGKVFASGGFSAQSALYEYNPVSNGWTGRSAMPSGRHQHGMAASSSRIYVTGGWASGSVRTDTLWEYHPIGVDAAVWYVGMVRR